RNVASPRTGSNTRSGRALSASLRALSSRTISPVRAFIAARHCSRGRRPRQKLVASAALNHEQSRPQTCYQVMPAETAGRQSNNGGGNGGEKLADRRKVGRILQLRLRLSVRNDGQPDLWVLHCLRRIQ